MMVTATSSLLVGDDDHLKLDDRSNLIAHVFVVVLVVMHVMVNSIETKLLTVNFGLPHSTIIFQLKQIKKEIIHCMQDKFYVENP